MTEKSEKKVLKDNRAEVRRALEVLFATDYLDKKKLYLENFIRGIFFAAGGVIGATVLIGLLIWVLSVFDQVPLIGPFIDNTKQSIEQSQNSL